MLMPMPPERIPDAEGCTATMYNKLSKCLVHAIINLLYLHNEVSAKWYSAPWWLWPRPMPMPPEKIPDAEGCTVTSTMYDKLSKCLIHAIINLLYLHNDFSTKCYLAPWWLWPMLMPMPPEKIPDAEGCTVTMYDKLSECLVYVIINLL
jgi:hypothetical protein